MVRRVSRAHQIEAAAAFVFSITKANHILFALFLSTRVIFSITQSVFRPTGLINAENLDGFTHTERLRAESRIQIRVDDLDRRRTTMERGTYVIRRSIYLKLNRTAPFETSVPITKIRHEYSLSRLLFRGISR